MITETEFQYVRMQDWFNAVIIAMCLLDKENYHDLYTNMDKQRKVLEQIKELPPKRIDTPDDNIVIGSDNPTNAVITVKEDKENWANLH